MELQLVEAKLRAAQFAFEREEAVQKATAMERRVEQSAVRPRRDLNPRHLDLDR
jgi:hypothetical protein